MNKRLDFTGGNPDIRLDQILIDANANRPAMFAMMNSYAVGTNPNFIIDGCVVTIGGASPNNTYAITAGYIFLNGEILEVEAQNGTWDIVSDELAYGKVVTYDSRGDIIYNDATPRQTWQKNRGVVAVQASVSVAELDARNGDRIDEKLRSYIGDASTSIKGVVLKSTPAAAASGTPDSFIDAELMQTANGKAWQTPSYNANFSAGAVPLQYRINRGKLEMRGEVVSTVLTSLSAFTLPVGFRPINDTVTIMSTVGATLVPISMEVRSDGQVRAYDWSNTIINRINSIIILD